MSNSQPYPLQLRRIKTKIFFEFWKPMFNIEFLRFINCGSIWEQIFSFVHFKSITKKFAGLTIFFLAFSIFYKNLNLLTHIFVIFSIHKPSLGSCEVSHKIWADWLLGQFQLWTFSLCIHWKKQQQKFTDFIKNVDFKNFYENRICWGQIFENLIICKSSLGSGVNKGGYWGYLPPPPRILGVTNPPLDS